MPMARNDHSTPRKIWTSSPARRCALATLALIVIDPVVLTEQRRLETTNGDVRRGELLPLVTLSELRFGAAGLRCRSLLEEHGRQTSGRARHGRARTHTRRRAHRCSLSGAMPGNHGGGRAPPVRAKSNIGPDGGGTSPPSRRRRLPVARRSGSNGDNRVCGIGARTAAGDRSKRPTPTSARPRTMPTTSCAPCFNDAGGAIEQRSDVLACPALTPRPATFPWKRTIERSARCRACPHRRQDNGIQRPAQRLEPADRVAATTSRLKNTASTAVTAAPQLKKKGGSVTAVTDTAKVYARATVTGDEPATDAVSGYRKATR